eukprot:2942397-Prymnesium_polylepis.1
MTPQPQLRPVLGAVGQRCPPNLVVVQRYQTCVGPKGHDQKINYHTDGRVALGRWCAQRRGSPVDSISVGRRMLMMVRAIIGGDPKKLGEEEIAAFLDDMT